MKTITHRRISLISAINRLGLFAVLLLCCGFVPTVPPFDPRQVSCHFTEDNAIYYDAEEHFEKIHKNATDENFLPAMYGYMHTIKQTSNKGNIVAVWMYGVSTVIIKGADLWDVKQLKIDQQMPEEYKSIFIDMATYAYIADIAPYTTSKKLRKEIKESARMTSLMSDKKMEYYVPQHWLDEAKAHAESWRTHCGF